MRKLLFVYLLFLAKISAAQLVTLKPFFKDRNPYILYMGIDNVVYLENLPKDHDLKMKKGSVGEKEGGFLIIQEAFCVNNYKDTLLIYKDGQLHSKIGFTVSSPPRGDTSVTIGNSCSDRMTKEEILADPTIRIWPDDSDLKIDSLKMSILGKRCDIQGPFAIKGGTFLNDATKMNLSLLRQGDRVVFSNIKVKTTHGSTISLPEEYHILIK